MPDAAEQIPSNVLTSPLIGEFWRFDGSTAPSGWMLAQGQTLNVTDNPHLFSVLGRIAGGDGKTTFKLPNPGFGAVIAVAGTFLSAPAMLASSGRRMTRQDSLGPSAVRAPLRAQKVTQKAQTDLAAQRRLFTSAVRVGRPSPVPVTPELANRYGQATADARTSALGELGANSRARLDAAVAAALAGSTSVYGVVAEMISSLTNAEADALLRVNDTTMIQPFNDRVSASRSDDARIDAAHFLVSVAITRDQAKAIYRIERSRER